MKFSLLYKVPEQADYAAQQDMREAIYNLSVDRLVNAICTDPTHAEALQKVLGRPLHLEENIYFRQEIIENFTKQPQLLFELKRLFRRYDTIKADWGEMRSNVHPYGASVSYKALMEYTFDLLKVSAKFAKMIAGYFKSAYEILDQFELTAPGLVAIKDYCVEMINNDSLNEVVEIANLFSLYSPPQYEFTVMAGLDDTLRVTACDLIKIVDLEKLAKDRKIWNVVKNIKNRAGRDPEFNLGNGLIDDSNFLLNEALFRVYTVMTEVAEYVYDMFYGLSDELTFYEGALDYINYLRRHRVTYCIPRIRPHDAEVFNADGLYDCMLLVEGKNRDTIVTNSVRLSGAETGILIRGNNSTGKTVYLRSIGTAQLMSQAGLPVCARRASISMRNAIFTQFSSAEKEFVVGDTAGRFEGEVQEVAHILDHIKPHSLVLLNETFQTTAYIEGARGIFDILRIFPKIDVKFIFVTRMTKLFEMCYHTDIKLMESGEGDDYYKIRPVVLDE